MQGTLPTLGQAQALGVPAPLRPTPLPAAPRRSPWHVWGLHRGGPRRAGWAPVLPGEAPPAPPHRLWGFSAPTRLTRVPLGEAGQVGACTRCAAPSFNLE